MSETQPADRSPAADLRQVLDDQRFVHAVLVAGKLGLADLLKAGPLSIADLARATDARGFAVPLLRALASRDVFREDADGRFALTDAADPLRRDAPNSIRAGALLQGSEAMQRTWANLEHSVRTGQPAVEHLYGKPWFDCLGEQPELARRAWPGGVDEVRHPPYVTVLPQ